VAGVKSSTLGAARRGLAIEAIGDIPDVLLDGLEMHEQFVELRIRSGRL
jgi:hypothetical protein